MARFDDLLRESSASLDDWLGETWYATEIGSPSFIALRVLICEEVDANRTTNVDVLAGVESKQVQFYKNPLTVIGGREMGGLSRPVIDRTAFVRGEDLGAPDSPLWIVKEIVQDDLYTITVRVERAQIMNVGNTNRK